MIKKITTTLILATCACILPLTSYAAPRDSIIFSCKTNSGKIVRFINLGKSIQYSYGKPGTTPDLTFSVPRNATSINDGSENLGAGSWWMTQEIKLKFNGTTYTGSWSYHRATGEEAGGILVTRGEKTLAETPCKSDMKMNLSAY